MPIQTWMRDWNDMIRNVFYKDEELKRLMKVPENTSIIDFIDRYFIQAGWTNTTLVDEPVRIVYGVVGSDDTAAPNVKQQEMSFDIYVRQEDLHNVCADRLVLRTQLIADRINRLLTQERYHGGYRFWIRGEADLGTRTQGYVRHNISFNYMKVY